MTPFICILYKAKLRRWKRVVSKELGLGVTRSRQEGIV